LDGQAYTTLRQGSITLAVARNLPGDTFNSYYSAAPVPGLRAVSVDFGLYDDDSANLKALKQKAFNKTAVDLLFQIGTVAGNKWGFTTKNVMLPAPTLDYGSDHRAMSFSGAKAHDTSIGAKDAVTLAVT